MATDKIRPCTPEKALDYLYLNQQDLSQYVPARSDDQQRSINEFQEKRFDQVDEEVAEPDLV